MDSQSPSSVLNRNGKREMRQSKTPLSRTSNAVESEAMECDQPDGRSSPELILAVSRIGQAESASLQPPQLLQKVTWPNQLERPQRLIGLKSKRLNIPVSVKEDLPSPSTDFAKLSFVSPLACCVGGRLPDDSPTRSVPPSDICASAQNPLFTSAAHQVPSTNCQAVFATNPFFSTGRPSTDSVESSASTLTAGGVAGVRLSNQQSSSSSDFSPGAATSSSTSGVASQASCCSSAESTAPSITSYSRYCKGGGVITAQCSVDSVAPSSAENPLFADTPRAGANPFRFQRIDLRKSGGGSAGEESSVRSTSSASSKSAEPPTTDPSVESSQPVSSSNAPSISQRLSQLFKRNAALPFMTGFSSAASGSAAACSGGGRSSVSGFFGSYFSRRAAAAMGEGNGSMTRSHTTNMSVVQQATPSQERPPPAKSRSEAETLYALCADELDSPESGFAESPMRDSMADSKSSTATAQSSTSSFCPREPDLESISSASSIEITVS